MQATSSIATTLINFDNKLQSHIVEGTLEANYRALWTEIKGIKNDLGKPDANNLDLYLFRFLTERKSKERDEFFKCQPESLKKWRKERNIGLQGNNQDHSESADVTSAVAATAASRSEEALMETSHDKMEKVPEGANGDDLEQVGMENLDDATPNQTAIPKKGIPDTTITPRGTPDTRIRQDVTQPSIITINDDNNSDNENENTQLAKGSAPQTRKRLPRKTRTQVVVTDIDSENEDELDLDESDNYQVPTKRRIGMRGTEKQPRPTKQRRVVKGTGALHEKPCRNCAGRKVKCEEHKPGGSCLACYASKRKCEYAGPRGGWPGLHKKKQKNKEYIEITDEESDAVGNAGAAGDKPPTEHQISKAEGSKLRTVAETSKPKEPTNGDNNDEHEEEWRVRRRAEKRPLKQKNKMPAPNAYDTVVEKVHTLSTKCDELLYGTDNGLGIAAGLANIPALLGQILTRLDVFEERLNDLTLIQKDINEYLGWPVGGMTPVPDSRHHDYYASAHIVDFRTEAAAAERWKRWVEREGLGKVKGTYKSYREMHEDLANKAYALYEARLAKIRVEEQSEEQNRDTAEGSAATKSQLIGAELFPPAGTPSAGPSKNLESRSVPIASSFWDTEDQSNYHDIQMQDINEGPVPQNTQSIYATREVVKEVVHVANDDAIPHDPSGSSSIPPSFFNRESYYAKSDGQSSTIGLSETVGASTVHGLMAGVGALDNVGALTTLGSSTNIGASTTLGASTAVGALTTVGASTIHGTLENIGALTPSVLSATQRALVTVVDHQRLDISNIPIGALAAIGVPHSSESHNTSDILSQNDDNIDDPMQGVTPHSHPQLPEILDPSVNLYRLAGGSANVISPQPNEDRDSSKPVNNNDKPDVGSFREDSRILTNPEISTHSATHIPDTLNKSNQTSSSQLDHTTIPNVKLIPPTPLSSQSKEDAGQSLAPPVSEDVPVRRSPRLNSRNLTPSPN